MGTAPHPSSAAWHCRADAASPASGPVISVVVPAFNEAQVLPQLNRRLLASLHGLGESFEVVYVDDGSTDNTADVLKSMRAADPAVGIVRLSRNFGKEVALTAGLRATRGECVVILDADLQDPPELIPIMVVAWRRGHDVVNMRRRRRDGETWFKKQSARLFYRTLKRVGDLPIPPDVGDFRLLSRRVVDAVNALPERNRYMKGLFAWAGYRQVTLEYDRDARSVGAAKQNYRRLWGLAIDGITSFSVAPLRLAFIVGLLAAGAAFALTLFYVAKTLVFGEVVQGFPTLIVALLTLGGLNLLGIGVLGEYLGRMFIEVKGRPLYVVDEYLPPLSSSQPASTPQAAA